MRGERCSNSRAKRSAWSPAKCGSSSSRAPARSSAVVSRLPQGTDRIDVALAFREHFGFSEIYLADLNANAGRPPALRVFDELLRQRFHLWVDAGLRGAGDAEPLLERGVDAIVAG